MYSYGSEDEDYDYDTFSMGSDDMEVFGRCNDDEAVEGEDVRYETYEMSSGDEFSMDDGEDDCVVDDSMITSYEDFHASRTKDDEDEPFFDESNQEEMRRDNDRLYDDYEDHLYRTHVHADNGEWLQRLSLDELDAFGLDDKCDCEGCYHIIFSLMLLKSNSPELTELLLLHDYAIGFDDFGWRLLGSYIGSNTHLFRIDMGGVELTEEILSSLAEGSKCESRTNNSVRDIDFSRTNLGIEELTWLTKMLKGFSKLDTLNFSGNEMIKSEGLDIIMSTMAPLTLSEIHLNDCGIERFEVDLPLPLQFLSLCSNSITTAGCGDLARLLRKNDCILGALILIDNDICNEGATMLANALCTNKHLSIIDLRCNPNITEEGHKSFLSVVNDMSSIQNTLASNHTLTSVTFGDRLFLEFDDGEEVLSSVDSNSAALSHLNDALQINAIHSREEAGRKKVITTQLNIHRRDELSRLQGLSELSLFPDCPIHLLPEILSLIGTNHRLSEMYPVLNAFISTLMSMTRSQGSAGNTKSNQPKRTRKRRHEVLRQRIDGRGYIM